jgi:enoyl-CoA hydratase
MSVRYDRLGDIAVVTIDRPETRNAIDLATADALRAAWLDFDADTEAAVGILTGADGTFCSGADLKRFDLVDRPEGHLGMSRLRVSKPTIAAVEGHAVAGGLELALWCDLRVAAADALLGCFERRWGVPLIDGGTQRLPRIVGVGRAMDLMLTGRPVAADEALAMGLVNRVSAPGRSLEVAKALAAEIASFPQPTVRSDRAALLDGLGLPLDDGLAAERRHGLEVLDTAAAGAARYAAGRRSPATTAEE